MGIARSILRSFSTPNGLALHRKRAHPVQFNSEISTTRVKARWSDEETRLLALSEIGLSSSTCNINEVLRNRFPGRTLEAIKGKRKQRHYTDLLNQLLHGASDSSVPAETTTALEEVVPIHESHPSENVAATANVTAAPVSPLPNLTLFPDHLLALSQQEDVLPDLQQLILQCLASPSQALEHLETFLPLTFPSTHRKVNCPKTGLIHSARRRHHRIKEYAKVQNMYKKDRTKAAHYILDGENSSTATPSKEDINATFGELFSSSSPPDTIYCIPINPPCTIFYSITVKEISKALQASPKSAPGPDGLTISDIKGKNKIYLAVLFNICLWSRDLPKSLKISKTILIPKSGYLNLASNWRPITISSVLLRLLHKILALRLNLVTHLSPAQRAFLPLTVAPLKRNKKIYILRIYAIPRLLHALTLGRYSIGWLKTIDCKIRGFVKSTLRLPSSTSNASLYASIKDGGFSIPCLTQSIPRVTLMRLSTINDQGDRDCMAFATSPRYFSNRKKCLKFLGSTATKYEQKKFWRDSLYSSVNGRGLDQVQDSPGNSWFGQGTRFTSGRVFINLCRLRTNSLMCREFNTRGRRNGHRLCRANCQKVESLSHIMQGCPATHWFRVTTHNRLLSMVADKFSSIGYNVTVEPRITINGELRKPDIILTIDRELTICDLTVGWETSQSLDDRHIAKMDYYGTQAMRNHLKEKWPNHSINFQAIALSCRGGIAPLSHTFLQTCHWTSRDISLLCLRCIEKLLNIYWGFFAATSRIGERALI
ncbi:unnamed protein product [Darwinula stevensoni]|uniref:Reverse transcriptase n=1 Tax=Darwinula stevensoni TaxID=69355 RepID=A0A7R9A2V1_9CRUS|nr:unnamed protein product [Darwinula stevensoni]CAG0890454.1 unnamed protein product [Darwinula stevensoni]